MGKVANIFKRNKETELPPEESTREDESLQEEELSGKSLQDGYTRPSWTTPSVLNKLRHGEVLKTPEGFQIRRVAGGFIYEYEEGSNVFVSTDELNTD